MTTRRATKKVTSPSTITAPPTEDAVTRARAEAEKLNAAELRLSMAYRLKASELAVLKSARGDAVLDAADPDEAARESGRHVSGLVQELDALADAARSARLRRVAGIPAVFGAECDSKEKQAATMETEASALEVESNRLRAALEQHDDCSYVPTPPSTPERMMGGQQGGSLTIVYYRVPRFERLRGEAQALRTQAAQGRFRTAHAAGSLEADCVEDLIELVYSDPMRIGPSAAEIIEWVSQSVEKEKRRRERTHSTEDLFVASDHPMKLHLTFQNSRIDQAQSWIVQPEPREVKAWAENNGPGQRTSQVRKTRTDADAGAAIDRILSDPVQHSPYGDALATAAVVTIEDD